MEDKNFLKRYAIPKLSNTYIHVFFWQWAVLHLAGKTFPLSKIVPWESTWFNFWRAPIIDVSWVVVGVAGKVNKRLNLNKSLPLL